MILVWVDALALAWKRHQDRRQIRRDAYAQQAKLLRYLGVTGAVR